jgi:ubiquinone/menaquinone biosynthesis C-methylase UbiE
MGEYTISGGQKGKDRLDILSRTLAVETNRFLTNHEELKGANSLDLGCGAGAVSFQLLDFVGDSGTVIGYDFDEVKINHAELTAKENNAANIKFAVKDAYELDVKSEYDVIYSRFLLSHLNRPETVVENMFSALVSGGTLLLEDTDFSGHFAFPANEAFENYVSWYQRLLAIRGANANRGPELYSILKGAGFRDISFEVRQPVHILSEGKMMAEITLEAITEALVSEGVCTEEQVTRELAALKEFRLSEESMISLPRVFQYHARK